jgi:hypothetical protein
MTANLHDKMLAAIDAYFSASDGTEEEVAENLLLDVRDEINKQQSKAQPAPVQPVATGKPVLQVEQLLNDMLDTLPYNSPEYWIGRIKEVLSIYTTPPAAQPAPVRHPRWYCIDKTGMATLCADEDDARQSAKLAEQDWPRNAPYRAVQLCEYTPPAAQPAVQDVKELFGYEIWNRFYRSKEELLEEMVRPNSGYPQDWIEANIREVYVHGTYALAEEGRT